MNGGYTQGFAFPMTVRTSWAENHIPLDSLNGIVVDKSVNTASYMNKNGDCHKNKFCFLVMDTTGSHLTIEIVQCQVLDGLIPSVIKIYMLLIILRNS